MAKENLSTLPAVSADDHDVKVTITNIPVIRSAGMAGEALRDAGFGVWLLGEWAANYLRVDAVRKGKFYQKKRYYCPECGEHLNPAGAQPARVVDEASYAGSGPVIILVEFPGVTCPVCQKVSSCAREGEIRQRVTQAVANIYREWKITAEKREK